MLCGRRRTKCTRLFGIVSARLSTENHVDCVQLEQEVFPRLVSKGSLFAFRPSSGFWLQVKSAG